MFLLFETMELPLALWRDPFEVIPYPLVGELAIAGARVVVVNRQAIQRMIGRPMFQGTLSGCWCWMAFLTRSRLVDILSLHARLQQSKMGIS